MVKRYGDEGYIVVAATFHAPLSGRKIDPSRAMSRSRLPESLQALAVAAGLPTETVIREVRQVEDRLRVTADQTFHGIPLTPGSGIRAEFDYETGQLLNWGVTVPLMPAGPPPLPANEVMVRDQILYELVVNQGIGTLELTRMRPVVYFLDVQDNTDPERRTFATATELANARELRTRYTWQLIARVDGWRWAHGYADYGTGRLLETRVLRPGGSTSGTPKASQMIPTSGEFTVLDRGKGQMVRGALEPLSARPVRRGKVLGLVVDRIAVRALYDSSQNVLQLPQGTFRPTGPLDETLRSLTGVPIKP